MKKHSKTKSKLTKNRVFRFLKKLLIRADEKNKQRWASFLKDYRYLSMVSFVMVGLLCLWSGGIGILSIIALIPMCFYLQYSKGRTKKQFMTDFYLGGFVLCLFAYYFLSQSTLETWAVGVTGVMLFLAPIFILIFLSAISALSSLIIGYVFYRIRYKDRLFALVVLWPTMELLRSLIFSVANFGPGGNLLPSFNFAALAVDASGTPLIYLSRFFGFYGLSAMVVILNVCIYKIAFKSDRTQKLIYGLVLAEVIGLNFLTWQRGFAKANQQTVSVSAVHLNKEDWVDNYSGNMTLNSGTDVLVLPEYAIYSIDERIKEIASKVSDRGGVIMSSAEQADGYKINNFVVYNNKGERLSKQAKSFLIPGGEYMPYFMRTFLIITGKRDLLDMFEKEYPVTKGLVSEKIVKLSNNIRVGGLACSGVTRIDKYQNLADQGANILTNSAQLTLFPYDSFYFASARNMARYQAVVTNRPFIQSARGGESYIIDNQGNIIAKSVGEESQLLQAKVLVNP